MSFASMIIWEEYVLELHSIMHGGSSIRSCGIYIYLSSFPLWFWAWLQLSAFHLNLCSNRFEATMHPTHLQASHSYNKSPFTNLQSELTAPQTAASEPYLPTPMSP